MFIGYSSSSKAYKIFNKRTQCIEESIHVVFDEDESFKNTGLNDEDDVIKLFHSDKIEGSEADIEQQLKMTVMIRMIVYLKRLMRLKRVMRYLVLLRIPARVHQTPQKMMSLLMKKNMLISSTSLLQNQDGSIVHHILLIILFLP